MQKRYAEGDLEWIDLESPTAEEIRALQEEFSIEPSVSEELLLPSARARAEFYPKYVYLVFHFPALRHTRKEREQEVDFVIGEKFLITTRYDVVDPVHAFSKSFESHSILRKDDAREHAGILFFHMLKRFYDALEREVEFIRHDLSMIEENVFSDHQVEMVPAISRSARDLLNLRQTIEPHREILRSLEEEGAAFFGASFLLYLRQLSNEYYRAHNHIMRETESLHELRETNNSMLTTKQNEIMKTLTIIAFVTLPLSLISSIFEMNTHDTPILGAPHDFWIIIGGMGCLAALMIWYFKHKKWL